MAHCVTPQVDVVPVTHRLVKFCLQASSRSFWCVKTGSDTEQIRPWSKVTLAPPHSSSLTWSKAHADSRVHQLQSDVRVVSSKTSNQKLRIFSCINQVFGELFISWASTTRGPYRYDPGNQNETTAKSPQLHKSELALKHKDWRNTK